MDEKKPLCFADIESAVAYINMHLDVLRDMEIVGVSYLTTHKGRVAYVVKLTLPGADAMILHQNGQWI